VGATFSNRLLRAGKRGPVAPLDEVRCCLWTLAVDPGESRAVKNLLVYFNNTGNRLGEEQRYDAAVRVLTLGIAAAPADADLANNLSMAYDLWARELGGRGQYREALDRYREGVRALNGHAGEQERLTHNALALLDTWARPLLQANNWDEGIRVYETGLTYFPGNARLQDKLAQVRARKAE
jgi:tetratricopeptide (TPR) repeat protein